MSSLPAVPLSVSPGKEAVGGLPIDALQVAASPTIGANMDCDVADREADATDMAPAIPGMWNVVVCVVFLYAIAIRTIAFLTIPTGNLICHIFCSIRPLLSRKRGSQRRISRCVTSSAQSNTGRQTGLRCRAERSRWYGHGPRHPRYVKAGCLGMFSFFFSLSLSLSLLTLKKIP